MATAVRGDWDLDEEKPKLPTKWRGSYTDVLSLTDEQRQRLRLSNSKTIIEIIGWNEFGIKDGYAEVKKAVEYARAKKLTTLDTETAPKKEFEDDPEAALDPHKGRIVLLQLGDVDRQYLIWWDTISEEAKQLIIDVWGDPTVKKAVVNGKYDASMILAERGFQARGEGLLDCQIIEQILNAGMTGDIGQTMKLTGMGPMASRWLGLKLVKDEDVRTGWGKMIPGKWWKSREEVAADLRVALGESPTDIQIETAFQEQKRAGEVKRYYAADDCVIPPRLLQHQLPWIRHLDLLETLKLEMAFLPDLADMEVRGLLLDWPAWEKLAYEAQAGYQKAVRDLDRLFEVTVTYRRDMDGNVEVTRDKNYGSKDELKNLIREWMWKHTGVDVICNNAHFRESLERQGINPARLDKLFEKKLVPNPEKPGSNKQVGYPAMADYIEGSEFVESLWGRFEEKLSDKTLVLTTTDSKYLLLMKILHNTPDHMIEPEMPTKIGLPPELVDPILALRDYGTKLQRYAFTWRDLINPVSGRIHTDTTQCAADTARLTTRPNFQNLPAKQAYRSCIIAKPGFKIVGADFSQIEPRIIAEISNDPTYMRIFWSEMPGTPGFAYWCGDDVTEPLDLYGGVGAQIGVMPPEGAKKSVAKQKDNPVIALGRKKAKIVVLGLGYGTGKPKFQITYILDTKEYHLREESDALYDAFFDGVAAVKAALDALSEIADPKKSKRKIYHPFVDAKVTWSESLGGRKRFFDLGAPNFYTVGRNHPIQSTGADILKRTVVELSAWMRKNGIEGGIILTAHDELLAEVREDQADLVAKAMEKIMSKVGQRYCPHVPITAEAYTADHWVKD